MHQKSDFESQKMFPFREGVTWVLRRSNKPEIFVQRGHKEHQNVFDPQRIQNNVFLKGYKRAYWSKFIPFPTVLILVLDQTEKPIDYDGRSRSLV